MQQVLNHTFKINGEEYECKIYRVTTGFLESECNVTIFAPTELPNEFFQVEFFREPIMNEAGSWKFRDRSLPQRIINLEEKLTLIINNYTNM